MKAGFKPKLFTKKEWQDNRSRACTKSGVGKALDEWQVNCTGKVSEMTSAQIAKAFQTAKKLDAALDVAKKKCNPKNQKETIAGIGEYKKKVKEFQDLLKAANIALDKRDKLKGSLNLQSVTKDAELLKSFTEFSQKKAFIYPSLHTYLLVGKKKYEDAVKLYSEKGKGGGDYNTDPKTNKILYNAFVAKVYEEQKDILKAIAKLESDQVQMLTDNRHYESFSEWPSFVKIMEKRFPIGDFKL